MSLGDLAVLYVVVGLACGVAIYRTAHDTRAKAVASAALAIPLWPLWAPIILTSNKAKPRPAGLDGSSHERVIAALREGVDACVGTPLEALLSREAAARIEDEVGRAVARSGELEALLCRDGFVVEEAERRVADLERAGTSSRALATARLHLDNVNRLARLRDSDARALDELADLVQALRTQLVLARFAGSSLEGASGIVTEVWARVEGLGVAIDASDLPEGEVEEPAEGPRASA